MSHVRLSNGSPTLERMEARQADYPKPSACRSLFGPVDHDELARELQRHRRDLADASRRKWNFDFQRHQPLDGRYEWRAVAQDALPDFYTRPPRLRRTPAQPDGSRRSLGRAAEEPPRNAVVAAAVVAPAELGAGPRKRPAADPDDSSHPNKRANATEVIPEDSPSASSVEQTPKKSSPRRHQT
ncbi:cyclin-dependent kinase inhibitor 1B [Paroedura picta]|uniref:cyclin-dependent kinase inhibitor 1B n=1 Tax=Paroedura picta TaxID=143630 RepID=UPI0040562A37